MKPLDFRREQRLVALGMAAAVLVTLVSLSAAAWLSPSGPTSLSERFGHAVVSDLFVVVWLAVGVGNIARMRFFSEQDIAGSALTEQSQALRVASAFLQNTLEQVALAIPVHLALAALMNENQLVFPVLAGLFSVGRLLFWAGYTHGAAARAFGFALTFYPSVAALLWAGYLAISGA